MNFQKLLRPIPRTAMIQMPDYYVWCGALDCDTQSGRHHLIYSRWPKSAGFDAWATHSEIALATGESPFGPWKHEQVLLPARGENYWDGKCTHNPTLVKTASGYLLYYMGNTGSGPWWEHRNHQRIGLATAENIRGPWKRSDRALIEPDLGFSDALLCSNPAVTERIDGGWLMIYKAVGDQKPLPFGGPVVHVAALSENPGGPFKKIPGHLFTKVGEQFAAEDPFIWHQHGRYWAIVKDMKGIFTGVGTSLAMFESSDGFHWQPGATPLVSGLELHWADGTLENVERLERPQLWISQGKPVALCCAVRFHSGDTANIQIPLGCL